jgi:hypothetical protein
MDPFFASVIVVLVRFWYQLGKAIYGNLAANVFLVKHYGLASPLLILFGSKDVLRAELQVLASVDERVASEFKKASQDESSMIAVAVSDLESDLIVPRVTVY